jgi:4-oxalmesaconate hydratase
VAKEWTRASNDLISHVASLFPEHSALVAQLPQTPEGNLGGVLAELRRTVMGLGFADPNLNPDPSGTWTARPLKDESWFPVFEAAEEFEVPFIMHVSTACNPNFHTLGGHYLNSGTDVFIQLLQPL